jgi:hypothetical protein
MAPKLAAFFDEFDLCCDVLSRLYTRHHRGVQNAVIVPRKNFSKEMLTLPGQGSTDIIMYALDECPITSNIPSPREGVLELVDELVNLLPPNLHICVTSRTEADTQAVLQPLCSHPVFLHNENG